MRLGWERSVSSEFRPECHINYVRTQAAEKHAQAWQTVPAVDRVRTLSSKRSRLYSLFSLYWKQGSGRSQAADLLGRSDSSVRIFLTTYYMLYIISFTHMARSKPPHPVDAKAAALRGQGGLHPHPGAVQDEAFRSHEFFDPRDLVQVRYEMLRRHQVEGWPVTEVAASFGVSRQAFYVTEASFQGRGLPGLLPRRRGPKRAHKCTDEILDFVEQWRETAKPEEGETVTQAIERRFGVQINPRSIDRALARRKKKPSVKPEGKK
jgi:transposase